MSQSPRPRRPAQRADAVDTRSALRTALVRGSAFALVTAAYLLIGGRLGGSLWCVYVLSLIHI